MAPRTSWASFAQGLNKQSLMDDMMAVQHVDLLAAVRGGDAFVRARANCRSCACEQACREWFLKGSAGDAEFCPNRDFFASLGDAAEES